VVGATAFFVQAAFQFVRRAVCSMRGHDLMLEFAPKRLSLRCAACGFNTPGWELDLKVRPAMRPPRLRVIARTASAIVKQQLPAPPHTADHANAA